MLIHDWDNAGRKTDLEDISKIVKLYYEVLAA
jgi:hypothetical protein